MNDKLISIIVPVYNAEKYLKKCVESIIQQSYQNIEIILVDDGSTDSSGDICDHLQGKDPRVKVIHKKNEGANAARKSGIKIAQGEYIGFVDSDDWINIDMYKYMHNAIIKNPKIDVVICAYIEVYENRNKYIPLTRNGFAEGNTLQSIQGDMIYNGKFFGANINGALWNKLFRKDIIFKYVVESIDDLTIGEDSAILYPSILDSKAIYFLNGKGYYYYRIREGSVSLSYKKDLFKNSKKWMRWMKKHCNAKENIEINKQIEGYFACLGISAIVNEYRRNSKCDSTNPRRTIKKIICDEDMTKVIRKLDISDYAMRDKIFVLLIRLKRIMIIDILLRVKEKNNARSN